MNRLINNHCEIKENEGSMMRVEVHVGEIVFDAIEAGDELLAFAPKPSHD